jgi:hypothetical protein
MVPSSEDKTKKVIHSGLSHGHVNIAGELRVPKSRSLDVHVCRAGDLYRATESQCLQPHLKDRRPVGQAMYTEGLF